jgi:hypothetical protein
MKVAIAIFVAVLYLVGALAGSYGLTVHLVDTNNGKFCQYLETVVPRTPKPVDPAKNPSRAVNYRFSLKTDRFEKTIGCK